MHYISIPCIFAIAAMFLCSEKSQVQSVAILSPTPYGTHSPALYSDKRDDEELGLLMLLLLASRNRDNCCCRCNRNYNNNQNRYSYLQPRYPKEVLMDDKIIGSDDRHVNDFDVEEDDSEESNEE